MTFDKQTMLDAHVAFELQRWQQASLRATIGEEAGALVAWMETVSLNEIVGSEQVMGFVRRIVIDRPLAPEAVDSIRESVQVALEMLSEDTTPLEALLPRPLYDRLAANVIGMEDLRWEVTHQVVTSSVYTMLISNVLYHGIKDFMLSENAISRKIPGATSLVRFGHNAFVNAAPQVEKMIDRRLIAFIHDNIQETIRESERFLNTAVDVPMMESVAGELWATNSPKTISALSGGIDPAAADELVEVVIDFWLHFRATPFMLEFVEQVVRNYFLRNGKKSLRTLLDELGVTTESLADEIHTAVAPAITVACASGSLEARIRRRLAAFYDSYTP
ncbi:MAG: hypothetical protein M9936_19205 [Caldilinea sp.]|nr:hypothetical protein [Caldilinea sp.]